MIKGTAKDSNKRHLMLPKTISSSRPKAGISEKEVTRYSRHLVMPEVGMEGQKKLKASSVLVVGGGGLGTPAAAYLTAAGVGRVGLVDYDVIEVSNLHRQVLYSESDLGKGKVDVLAARLARVNPHVDVRRHNVRLDSINALDIMKDYAIVVDGSDNLPTRYLVNDACALLGKPDVYASVFRLEGQASVFFAKEGPCYRCLYPEPPPPDSVPSCAEAGVLGVLPGIMGSIQAAEAIKMILGEGDPLIGRLLLFNAADTKFTEFKIKKSPSCPVCGPHQTIKRLIDYEAFCSADEGYRLGSGFETTPLELKRSLDRGGKITLLDVREPFESAICRIEGSKLIPLGELEGRVDELERSSTIVVYCHTGRRSATATRFLLEKGFKSAKNLKGGIKAWAEEVDPKMSMY